MARPLAVPFALPDRRASRTTPLGLPHFVLLVAGLLLAPVFLVAMFYPVAVEHLARQDVRGYRAAFGFDVGGVATDDGDSTWGITRVTAGGRAERAGLRAGDVILTYHGTPGNFFEWALLAAAAGTEACLDVSNMPARLAGMRSQSLPRLGADR